MRIPRAGCGLLVVVMRGAAAWLWLWAMGMRCRIAERLQPATPCPLHERLLLPWVRHVAARRPQPRSHRCPPHPLHQAHNRRMPDLLLFEVDKPGQQQESTRPRSSSSSTCSTRSSGGRPASATSGCVSPPRRSKPSRSTDSTPLPTSTEDTLLGQARETKRLRRRSTIYTSDSESHSSKTIVVAIPSWICPFLEKKTNRANKVSSNHKTKK